MTDETQTTSQRRYCSFYIKDRRYAIDILAVREIHRPLGVTPVQRSSDFVRGLVNLRGQIITVLDPAVRLGLPPCEPCALSRLVIIKTNAEILDRGYDVTTCDSMVALWSDRISDVVTSGPGGLEPAPATIADSESSDLIEGVIQLEEDLVRVIAPQIMLREDEGVAAAQ